MSRFRGAGNNRAVSTATASSFLNTAGKVGRVTISERIEADKLMRAAERFLQLVPVQTRERGRSYHATGHVVKVTCVNPDRKAYTAVVRGSQDYAVTLNYSDQNWASDCSCPMRYDCKHTVAAMLELQRLWAEDPPATPATVSATNNKPIKKD